MDTMRRVWWRVTGAAPVRPGGRLVPGGVTAPAPCRSVQAVALCRWWWRATRARLPQDGLHHSWRGCSLRKYRPQRGASQARSRSRSELGGNAITAWARAAVRSSPAPTGRRRTFGPAPAGQSRTGTVGVRAAASFRCRTASGRGRSRAASGTRLAGAHGPGEERANGGPQLTHGGELPGVCGERIPVTVGGPPCRAPVTVGLPLCRGTVAVGRPPCRAPSSDGLPPTLGRSSRWARTHAVRPAASVRSSATPPPCRRGGW